MSNVDSFSSLVRQQFTKEVRFSQKLYSFAKLCDHHLNKYIYRVKFPRGENIIKKKTTKVLFLG